MAYIHPDVLVNGLQTLTETTSVHIINTNLDPADRARVLTDSLGSKEIVPEQFEIPNPSARGDGGMEVVIPAITDGSVTAEGTALRWALIDETRLLASNSLSLPQSVFEQNDFYLSSFIIGIPGAV